jgi:hypothetical protein
MVTMTPPMFASTPATRNLSHGVEAPLLPPPDARVEAVKS